MSATVRFSKVVESAGKPELHVLWGLPASDAVFQRAVKSHRVMTIRQENVGSKKDFGLIGFSQETSAQFLIFPRSLKAFEGQRVVGINYEIFDPPAARSGAPARNPRQEKKETVRKSVPTSAKNSNVADASPRRTTEVLKPSPTVNSPTDKAAPPVSLPLNKETGNSAADTRPQKSEDKSNPIKELNPVQVLTEVRKTMNELEAGKAVLAFRRLEKLAEYLESI